MTVISHMKVWTPNRCGLSVARAHVRLYGCALWLRPARCGRGAHTGSGSGSNPTCISTSPSGGDASPPPLPMAVIATAASLVAARACSRCSFVLRAACPNACLCSSSGLASFTRATCGGERETQHTLSFRLTLYISIRPQTLCAWCRTVLVAQLAGASRTTAGCQAT